MAALQSNAAEAIKGLFVQYGNEVYQYVRFTLGDPIQSEDVVQEIFLRALQAWHRFELRSSPRTWLWSIVRNHLRDELRKKKRLGQLQELDIHLFPGTLSSQDSYESVEIESILQYLSVQYRQMVILRIIQDNSTAEAAQILGWPKTKVRVTLHRALKKLQLIFTDGTIENDLRKGANPDGSERT